jgi:hypothetical protein
MANAWYFRNTDILENRNRNEATVNEKFYGWVYVNDGLFMKYKLSSDNLIH